MSHNIALPRHRFVHVVPEFVLQPSSRGPSAPIAIPAVWYGVSVTPGRVMGCHVLLENGATVIDLPLHALRTSAAACLRDWTIQQACRWDGFGWHAEVFEPPYLSGLSAQVLDAAHQLTGEVGTLWFALDHVRDGYSMEPAQHKHLWVVEMEHGCLVQVPQDQLLITDASFTAHSGVPRIQRQATVWTTEP
jgi:hypothetical protein